MKKKKKEIKFQPATLKNNGNNVTVTDIWGPFLQAPGTRLPGPLSCLVFHSRWEFQKV